MCSISKAGKNCSFWLISIISLRDKKKYCSKDVITKVIKKWLVAREKWFFVVLLSVGRFEVMNITT